MRGLFHLGKKLLFSCFFFFKSWTAALVPFYFFHVFPSLYSCSSLIPVSSVAFFSPWVRLSGGHDRMMTRSELDQSTDLLSKIIADARCPGTQVVDLRPNQGFLLESVFNPLYKFPESGSSRTNFKRFAVLMPLRRGEGSCLETSHSSGAAITPPPKSDWFEGAKSFTMRIETIDAEHTERLGTPTVEIGFANIARVRRFMHSEGSYHASYGYFFVTVWGWVGDGGGYGGTTYLLFPIPA